MPQPDPPQTVSLGADLRALRRARGVTLAKMAAALGRSVGWISQVERDKSHPTIDDLKAISGLLGVPISLFFGQNAAPAAERGHIVRKGARRRIGTGEAGLVEELLSPDLTDEFEVLHSLFRPGAALATPHRRPTTEVGYVIKGKLDMMIGEGRFTVAAGDSFRIRGEAHRWANPYDEPVEVIWVIAPPIY